jgi:hypothetical protein
LFLGDRPLDSYERVEWHGDHIQRPLPSFNFKASLICRIGYAASILRSNPLSSVAFSATSFPSPLLFPSLAFNPPYQTHLSPTTLPMPSQKVRQPFKCALALPQRASTNTA